MDDSTMRADVALSARGLAASREKARALIEAGLVTVNGEALSKPSRPVSDGDVLVVHGEAHPYVGRGGLKLEKALKVFGVDPTGLVCMDIGASTGGFTDVLLKNGARRVYAIDVGTGQLDPRLLKDERVVNMERTNARALTADAFPEKPTLAVMDVSFISIRLILPAVLHILGLNGRMLTLVKPQFEAGRAKLGKRGIVSDPDTHIGVLRSLVRFLPTLGWRVGALDFSPIAGGSGNLEFLADLLPSSGCDAMIPDAEIAQLVRRAHAEIPSRRHRVSE